MRNIESEMIELIEEHNREVEEFENNKKEGVIYDIDMNSMYKNNMISTVISPNILSYLKGLE